MSRLLGDRAAHTVLVQNRETTRDAEGGRVTLPVGERIEVRCLSEPVREWSAAEESQALGIQVTNMLVIRSRTWPGDINSHVIFDGGVYETVGVPQHFKLSRKTSHWRVTVKWIGKDGG
ncbi:hypothetical protein [Microbacterium trichothecenolyticum]|uniref:Phage head-tail joining protein n=1 Tax=Microbacterium trichothecenolyticum TaxID=69370 RepID=A0A0M2H0K6_MICTR|nr:hypothetical protein [Microbacterium trichothecenolyticum]KJL39911.1 hypothetical protein RS82_04124 [Microbacterium trichothecenolyticum]